MTRAEHFVNPNQQDLVQTWEAMLGAWGIRANTQLETPFGQINHREVRGTVKTEVTYALMMMVGGFT